MTAEFRLYLGCYHIGKNGWCKSGRIGIDQEEKRIIAEQLAAQLDKAAGIFLRSSRSRPLVLYRRMVGP